MKRFHVHVAVQDLESSLRFYTALFGSQPCVVKDDYAKWMLEDPRINFAISRRGRQPGLDHLGIQAETAGELEEVAGRLRLAGQPLVEQQAAACCYAESDKAWASDPQGIPWETFHTTGEIRVYGADAVPVESLARPEPPAASASCCAPRASGTR